MHALFRLAALALVLAGLTACPPPPPPPANPPTTPEQPDEPPPAEPAQAPMINEPPIWSSVGEVEQACTEHLGQADRLKAEILAVEGDRTLENTLEPLNGVLIELDRIQPTSQLIANVHPDKAVRTAAEACDQRAQKYLSELLLNRPLYDALSAVPAEGLDPAAARFREHLLRDYRRNGVDKDEATRKELAALHEKMVKLGQRFSRNIRESRKTIEVKPAQLAGVPDDFLQAKQKEAAKAGKRTLTISTDYPDFLPVQNYARRAPLRRQLYRLYLTRAYPENEKVLLELLRSRHAYATKLGYPDWAEYAAEDKMVRNKKTVAEFIEKVAGLARPRMTADLSQILARKRKDNRRARKVRMWDRFYYVNKIKAEKFGVDPTEVRAYFDFPAVKQGILELAQELFGLTFKRDPEAKVWHESVEAYDVFDGEQRIARFYLDLHPREGKYGHAAEFPILTGIPGVQLPSASLVTNFPDPGKTDGGPALTEHKQVTTFFHEFGHLMHQLLAGRHAWVTQSGITCEWDFVEAPSQLMEEWTWDAGVLARFARHHKTGKPIPAALVKKMRAARAFGKGVHVMRQMFYAGLSYDLHSRDPQGLELSAAVRGVMRRYSPYPEESGTAVHASFGHLNGYSSMYYTYMWSLVLAKDLFTRFQARGLMNREVALAYRKAILEPGGSVDAGAMVEAFLGRPSSFEAYQRWLQQ